MDTLVTDRLRLRAIQLDDVEAMYAYAIKHNIGPRAGWKPHQDIYETFHIIQLMIKEGDTWAITKKEEDLLIGTISLHAKDFFKALLNIKEIGFTLDDTYWNLGYVTEATKAVIQYAFETLDLSKVVIGHYADNHASQRVIEKCGFLYSHHEARLDYEKKPRDIVMYELRKEDYMKFRGGK